jgi:hypothetical protein
MFLLSRRERSVLWTPKTSERMLACFSGLRTGKKISREIVPYSKNIPGFQKENIFSFNTLNRREIIIEQRKILSDLKSQGKYSLISERSEIWYDFTMKFA